MLRNWADNLEYHAISVRYPKTVEQVQQLVRDSDKVKALGTRHSFSSIADTTGTLLSLKHFDQVVRLDLDAQCSMVTVEAGIKYGDLCDYLQSVGCALHNMASLPHISVAGACATATHGSGDGNGNLATAVAAMQFVRADGEVVTLARADEEFNGAVVGLGLIGVVTQLTLDVVPAFAMRQEVYENLPLAQAEAHFDAITSSAYSVSLFTDWKGPWFNQVWFKRRVEDSVAFELGFEHDATPATMPLHPIAGGPAENCTEQMGLRGPWNERLPHFRMGFTPSSGEELQTEYLIPRQNAMTALHAIYALREQIAPLLQISEVRTIQEDDLWMSPCYKQKCVAIHFTWKKSQEAVMALLPQIEATLAPLEARPHWGKLFAMNAAQLQPLYPMLPDFRQRLQSYDPEGKFRNEFLRELLFT